jgi:hypothetical protein
LLKINNGKKIELYRKKFKHNLIGKWQSFSGTFDVLMNELWIFYPDGNGVIISNSIMSGEVKESFRWRNNSIQCIEIDYFNKSYKKPCWEKIFYDFKLVSSEINSEIALIQLDKNKKQKKGFGTSDVPLMHTNSKS